MSNDGISLHSLSPFVRIVRINRKRGVSPAYIDPEYVFTYIAEGGGAFSLEGRRYSVKRGDLILMPPYMLHVIKPHHGCTIGQYVIHFDLYFQPGRAGRVMLDKNMTFNKFKRLATPEASWANVPYVLSPDEAEQKKVETLFVGLKEEFDAKRPGFELAAKAAMLELLCVYLRNMSAVTRSRRASTKGWRNLEKAIRWIHEHYWQPITLLQISKAAGLSMNYCCHLFKKYTYTSIHHYLTTVRIRQAKLLMEQADLNFSQIADKVGFSSVHLFSKVFKRMEGVSPSQYSRRITAKVKHPAASRGASLRNPAEPRTPSCPP